MKIIAQLQKILWSLIVIFVIVYGLYLLITIQLRHTIQSETIYVTDTRTNTAHVLTGTLLLESSCDDVTVRSQQISTQSYTLLFTIWHTSETNCISGFIQKKFRVAIDTSKNIILEGVRDGASIPVIIVGERHATSMLLYH